MGTILVTPNGAQLQEVGAGAPAALLPGSWGVPACARLRANGRRRGDSLFRRFLTTPSPFSCPCLMASARPQIADLIAAGKVKLEVALSLPLAEAAKAQEQVASGHTRGKVVLTV